MAGEGGGWLSGVEVKQFFGFERGRSALTGVGLIRRDGFVLLLETGQERHEEGVFETLVSSTIHTFHVQFN